MHDIEKAGKKARNSVVHEFRVPQVQSAIVSFVRRVKLRISCYVEGAKTRMTHSDSFDRFTSQPF